MMRLKSEIPPLRDDTKIPSLVVPNAPQGRRDLAFALDFGRQKSKIPPLRGCFAIAALRDDMGVRLRDDNGSEASG